jgi:hypothetical protein
MYRPAKLSIRRFAATTGWLVAAVAAASCSPEPEAPEGAAGSVALAGAQGLLATAATTPAAWKTNVNYAVGALVTYQGIVYQCRQAHRSSAGAEPTKAPALWQRPTPETNLPWTNQTHYTAALQVTYQNRLYRCLQQHVSQPDWTPTSAPTLWQLVPDAAVVMDPTITPSQPNLPGLSGGPPRVAGAVAGPNQPPQVIVLDEIALNPVSDSELQAFLTKWGGTVLRRGVFGTGTSPPPTGPGSLGPLVRINPATAPVSKLGQLLAMKGVQGTVRFSSDKAARLLAIALSDSRAMPNPLFTTQTTFEHPDDSGGNIDASDPAVFPWYSEDDDPTTPAIDGLSTGVVRAWDYLQYKGFPPPPPGGVWQPPVVAIIDCGFDIDASGTSNFDYTLPKQVDLVDRDGTAGGVTCPEKMPWHGNAVFSVAAARPNNSFGSAGVGGTVAIPMLMRTDMSFWTWADGIRSAMLRGASVVNLSVGGSCGWLCDLFLNIPEQINGSALFAVANGTIVVAAAGNNGIDLTGGHLQPCTSLGTICVGAVNDDKSNAFNFGAPVDIWAPMVKLATPDPISRNGDVDDIGIDELPQGFRGTSFASPFVAGVAAMMKALDPSIQQDRVLSILQSTANTSPDPRVARGYVDAFRAVEMVSPNVPPTLVVHAPTEGATLSPKGLTFHATVTDPDTKLAPNVKVQWISLGHGVLCEGTTCASGPLALGDHTLFVTALDPFDGATISVVHFRVANTAPTASITMPGDGASFFDGQLIGFRGTASDPDELIPTSQLSWSSNISGALGTGSDLLTTLPAGAHVITLSATDQFGAVGTDTITINVTAGSGAPSAQILQPANNLLFEPGTPIQFVGSGFDPEDGELPDSALSWSSDIDGPLGTGRNLSVVLSNASTSCPPESLDHRVTLTVTDSNGNQRSVTIVVRVGRIC